MSTNQPPTEEQKLRFIELLRKTGNVSVSARSIGFGPACIKKHREIDDDFDEMWSEAEMEANDNLEAEAWRRAMKGVKREKVIGGPLGKGGVRITEKDYSDPLLLRLMEANNPAKFTNRSKTEISNPDGSLAPNIDDTTLAARLSSLLAVAAQRMKAGG